MELIGDIGSNKWKNIITIEFNLDVIGVVRIGTCYRGY
jgi:hypothetical protein